MKKVYYIGWYVSEEDKDKYESNLSGNLKMHYVSKKILEAGLNVHVISLINKKINNIYFNHHSRQNQIDVTYLGGISNKTKISSKINLIIKKILLAIFLITKTHKEDTIIVYHSISITGLVAFINIFLKRRIICEVEEIYSYSAISDNHKAAKKEINSIKKYDSFILINDYLHKMLNIAQDNYCPCYGVVEIVPRKTSRFDDGYIHIVYAGTIENVNKGAFKAVSAAEFLPRNYKLHILGLGKKENIIKIKENINEVNKKQGFEIVEYIGFKSGDDLDQFLYSCHIGVSTYVMKELFADCSLPSKVFSYMCHDLAVVRGYSSAYENQEIAKNWYYYKVDTPQAIAEAIQEAKIPDLEYNVSFLKKCDQRLVAFLKEKC